MLEVRAQEPNTLVILLTENFFRPYRGKQQEYAAEVALAGDNQLQTVSLVPENFRNVGDDTALRSWSRLDQLGLAGRYDLKRAEMSRVLGTDKWAGPQPTFHRIHWEDKGASSR